MNTLRCDREGVPLLVQSIHYDSGMFDVLFFNDERKSFATCCVEPDYVNLPNEFWYSVHFWYIENWVTELAKTKWKEWFPSEQIH